MHADTVKFPLANSSYNDNDDLAMEHSVLH